jgi:hypothetical protein
MEVELVAIDEPEIMYKGVFEGDEKVVLMWSVIPGVRHYQWL